MSRVVVIGATGHIGTYLRYSSLGVLREALAWLVACGQADIGGQPFPAPAAPGAPP